MKDKPGVHRMPGRSPHVIILGAGPAGLGAAYRLARRSLFRVTVLEQSNRVGGNAGSFEIDGMRVDYGSHRLHPACDPEVLADIRTLLGKDLLDRPRHGRIRLQGRWIHFPLKFLDLVRHLPAGFVLGIATDRFRKALANHQNVSPETESFATVLEAGLGRTICHDFYFPYAQKLWGLPADQLSAVQAQRRISAGSVKKILQRIVRSVPGLRKAGTGRFYYPRFGYGQISDAFGQGAEQSGANIVLNARVHSVQTVEGKVKAVRYIQSDQVLSENADYVWSTIPITVLAKCLEPEVEREVLEAAEKVRFRAMILVYLILEQDRFSEYDAHYFPEPEIRISRLSEPKNYSQDQGVANRTVLCAELPCHPEDPEWTLSDEELGQLVCMATERAGIPIKAPVSRVIIRRLQQAYPVYQRGYKSHFDLLDQYVNQINGLLTFGRQGLFVHDNTHHALYMAYAAVKCLDDDGRFDIERWQEYRKIFETHVVED